MSKSDSWIDMSVLEDCMRDDLNARAPRRIAVLDPVKLVIDNYPEGASEECFAPNHPQQPGAGARDRCRSRASCWIERDDYDEHPPKGYFRLAPGAEVRLRYGYIVRCVGAEQGRRRQRHGRPLHLRPADAQRHARRRRAQGQGQHPLALGRARGPGRGAPLRPPVRGAVSGCAQPVRSARRRRCARRGAAPRGRRRRRRGRRAPRRRSSATTSTTSIPTRSA